MAWFRCPKCKAVFYRDARAKGYGGKTIRTYCENIGKMVRANRLKRKPKGAERWMI